MYSSKISIVLVVLGALLMQSPVTVSAADNAGSTASPASAARSPAAGQPTTPDAAAHHPNARVLGITESALNYCKGIDPSIALKLELQLQKQVKGVPQQELAKIRDSDEYHKAYSAESDFVAKVDEHNVKRICTRPLAKTR